jgi:hypothetical protein
LNIGAGKNLPQVKADIPRNNISGNKNQYKLDNSG